MDVREELLARVAALQPIISAHMAQLESVFEWLPVGMAIAYGADCARMRANSMLRALLGVTTRRNISKSARGGRDLPFRVYRDGLEAAPEDLPMQKAAREGIPLYSARCEIHRADGSVVILASVVEPWTSADGARRGSVGAFFDVSDIQTSLELFDEAISRADARGPLIRICAVCRKIAGDDDIWTTFEAFLGRAWKARFTHGLCPECYKGAMNAVSGEEPES